jgi:response regulator RpfG family c-di-GMP phosphodiesterase
MARILLVDDDDIFRPALQKTLSGLGYVVVPASNGEDALAMFKHSEFDLVISDIRMPKMDGLALTKEIKAIKNTPVILITGFAEILETHEAHQLGADEFLPKPFERKDLLLGIERCLKSSLIEKSVAVAEFCKLGIDNFISGRQIQFNVFVRLPGPKYVKIAYTGEDLPVDRVKIYKSKGIHFLYLLRDDFRTYVGFNVSLMKDIRKNQIISDTKKLNLLKHTGEVLYEQIAHDGIDRETFEGSAAFIETAVDILTDESEISDLLESLNQHTDYIFAHSVGTSLYSVLLAEMVDWKLPVNKFKVAVGALLHDVGQREIEKDLLMKPRSTWNLEEVQLYETHPIRSMKILNAVSYIPTEVLHIVKEHHEDCLAMGFPSRLKKGAWHPMAKLVAVANEFCNRVVKNPHFQKMTPVEAIMQMSHLSADRLDPVFFQALMKLFNFVPPQSANKNKVRFTG